MVYLFPRFGTAHRDVVHREPRGCSATPLNRPVGPASWPNWQRCERARTPVFTAGHIGCGGGKTYLGFGHHLRPGFEHFLSYGIPDKLEGERYKDSPETVKALVAATPSYTAPATYLVAKRIDKLLEGDTPQVAAFFATPDTLSGLFTLAGFEEADVHATLAPFSAGCGSLVKFPFLELAGSRQWPVLGMFDVSARPYVPANTLSFAVPWPRLERMVGNMDQSFLITPSWDLVRRRMASATTPDENA